MAVVRIIPAGPRAALVEVADAAAALSLARWADEQRIEADEIVPAARTVLLDGLRPGADLAALLEGWTVDLPIVPIGEVVVPVVYDGPDLSWVANAWRVSSDEVVSRHTALEFTSAFCGFSPGFAYLTGLPADWAVPRLDSPRERVAVGSVGLADAWCGVYPSASPGGWRLIGRTDAPLWDLGRDRPALLAPGTRVRFEAVG
jgi:KipI family sensor histidine kinase inhibitor